MRDILAVAMSVEADESALRATLALAEAFDGAAAALAVALHPGSRLAATDAPLSEVLADLAHTSTADIELKRQQIIDWAARAHRPMTVRAITAKDALFGKDVIAETLCTDLVILTRGAEIARRAMLETILFGAGRPVLVLAPDWRRERWDTILIAWNATRESRRAVAEAMPLLQRAKTVQIVTVDAKRSMKHPSEMPGRDIQRYLLQYGVTAEVQNLDGLGRSEAGALNDHATAIDADLIVMGAYGHARAREFLFGGVTRDMLSTAAAPLLLAH